MSVAVIDVSDKTVVVGTLVPVTCVYAPYTVVLDSYKYDVIGCNPPKSPVTAVSPKDAMNVAFISATSPVTAAL